MIPISGPKMKMAWYFQTVLSVGIIEMKVHLTQLFLNLSARIAFKPSNPSRLQQGTKPLSPFFLLP